VEITHAMDVRNIEKHAHVLCVEIQEGIIMNLQFKKKDNFQQFIYMTSNTNPIDVPDWMPLQAKKTEIKIKAGIREITVTLFRPRCKICKSEMIENGIGGFVCLQCDDDANQYLLSYTY